MGVVGGRGGGVVKVCESRQEERKDEDILNSSKYQRKEMKNTCSVGFIKKKKKLLSHCMFFLYHEKAPTDVLFWDATGSICRRNEDGKQISYYELAIRPPVRGKIGIPVTSKISSDQSSPIIYDLIKCFRREKKQY